MPFQCAHGAWSKNEEPSLDEMLAEPAVRLLMARDHVTEDAVRNVAQEAIQRMRLRLSKQPPDCSARPRAGLCCLRSFTDNLKCRVRGRFALSRIPTGLDFRGDSGRPFFLASGTEPEPAS
jgi:hypothetical protein